jgi:hypothetical protein
MIAQSREEHQRGAVDTSLYASDGVGLIAWTPAYEPIFRESRKRIPL